MRVHGLGYYFMSTGHRHHRHCQFSLLGLFIPWQKPFLSVCRQLVKRHCWDWRRDHVPTVREKNVWAASAPFSWAAPPSGFRLQQLKFQTEPLTRTPSSQDYLGVKVSAFLTHTRTWALPRTEHTATAICPGEGLLRPALLPASHHAQHSVS